MKAIFLDTHGLVALEHKRDQYYFKAHALKRELLKSGYIFIATNFILDEAYTFLRMHAGHHIAVSFGEAIKESRVIDVKSITFEIEEEAWKLFKKYNGGVNYSYTDCTSFAVMRQIGIKEAFTNDDHFDKAGFKKLL